MKDIREGIPIYENAVREDEVGHRDIKVKEADVRRIGRVGNDVRNKKGEVSLQSLYDIIVVKKVEGMEVSDGY